MEKYLLLIILFAIFPNFFAFVFYMLAALVAFILFCHALEYLVYSYINAFKTLKKDIKNLILFFKKLRSSLTGS